MRDFSNFPQSFCSQIENIVKGFLRKEPEVLSRITPSDFRDFENDFIITDKSKNNLIRIAILSWYIPDEGLGILLRMSVQEYLTPETEFLELLLESKAQMLIFLAETSLWHTRDFFGNILNRRMLRRTMIKLHYQRVMKSKPKYPERHRGYRDKGTLVQPQNKHFQWISTREQIEIEEERINRHHTYLFLQGFLGGIGG